MEPQDGTRALLLCEDRGDGPGTHRGPHPTMLTRLQTCEHPRLLRTSQRPSLLVAQRHAHVHPSQLSTSQEPLAGTKTPAVFNMTHQPGCWAPCRDRVAPRSHPSQTLSCWDSAQGLSRASALREARITGRRAGLPSLLCAVHLPSHTPGACCGALATAHLVLHPRRPPSESTSWTEVLFNAVPAAPAQVPSVCSWWKPSLGRKGTL